jgi:hypothetical protein
MALNADGTFARILFLMASATLLSATINAQDPTINSRNTPAVTRDMRYREWSMKSVEKNSARTPEEQKLAWSQIRDDFKHIQVIDNELAKHRASSETLNAKLVEKSVAEIHKCATRLQVNLAFPKETAAPGDKSQNEYQINTLLSGLSGLIKRFVNNPVFGEVEVLDVQAAASAKRDLDRIIELSEHIKKKAQNGKQEVKQPQWSTPSPLRDAFRAADGAPEEAEGFTKRLRQKINQLKEAVGI